MRVRPAVLLVWLVLWLCGCVLFWLQLRVGCVSGWLRLLCGLLTVLGCVIMVSVVGFAFVFVGCGCGGSLVGGGYFGGLFGLIFTSLGVDGFIVALDAWFAYEAIVGVLGFVFYC